MRRPSLLFLSQTLPFPPDSGVSVRTFNVLRLLSRDFDITALCFYRRAERSSAGAIAASLAGLAPFAHAEAFPIPQEHSRLRRVLDHLMSLVTRKAYTLRAYSSSAYRARILSILADGQMDLVHVDSMDLAAYLPLLKGVPVVCTHHNVESHLLRRRAAALSGFRRRYLMLQGSWLERVEREWCPRVALNVTVSEPDQVELATMARGSRVEVIPNGVDTMAFRPSVTPEEEGIVFVGGANWFPNTDALEYFEGDILPVIRESGRNPTVRWVGRSSVEQREQYARKGVDLTGYVEDPRPLVLAAACYVVPLRIGGGTRLKILDAWALGKAVVSTSVGCEGLDARDGENILIRDTPATFAAAVVELLENPALRLRLGAAARATAEQRYSWDVIGEKLSSLYRSVAAAV
jgi:glycosyltransferase involved in cell wall biosynthesis